MTPTILLGSGRYFNLLNPRAEDVHIFDIAAALSKLCRFTGHVREFYSVAQHSYLASYLVPPDYALQALLHDAAEAYIGDVARPLKHLLPDYREIEQRVEAVVFERFHLPAVLHESVKHADLVMLATEQRDLMPDHDDEWAILRGITPLDGPLAPRIPDVAERIFMQRFIHLTGAGSALHTSLTHHPIQTETPSC